MEARVSGDSLDELSIFELGYEHRHAVGGSSPVIQFADRVLLPHASPVFQFARRGLPFLASRVIQFVR